MHILSGKKVYTKNNWYRRNSANVLIGGAIALMHAASIIFLTEQLSAGEQYEEQVRHLLEQYSSLGPLPGLLLPFLESFLPFLPLIAFVIANAAAYGLFKGFILSWAGSSLGSILVFLLFRRLGRKKWLRKLSGNKQVASVMKWFERHGFGPLFLLLCFPFSPSSVINVVAGLSRVSTQQFILAVLFGKSVMIFSVAYVGASIMSFAENPVRTVIVGVCIALFWILGKFVEKRLHNKNRI